MTFPAKFPSVCPTCHLPIAVGEPIEWRKGEKARHAICPPDRARVHQEREAAIESSRAVEAMIDVPAPDGLAYLPFQRAGIAYAMARPSCLIADEMGLGKTIQAVGVINADPSIQTVLVVCPASLKLNWARELQRWLTRPYTLQIANGAFPRSAQIVIVNYDILRKHREALRTRAWDLLVADECHYLKNPKAQRTKEVLGAKDMDSIPARRRLFLTGTPIVNRPIELWPLLKAVDPKGLGRNWRDYVMRYCAAYQDRWGWKVDGASHLDELQTKLRSTIMVRRLKKDVLTDLPPKRRQVIEVPANGAESVVAAEAAAFAAHESRLAELRHAVEQAKASEDPDDYAAAVKRLNEGTMAAFTEIAKRRHDVAVAKVPAVVEHIQDTLESVDKLVVFSHHHDVSDALMAALGDVAVLHRGDLSAEQKDIAVRRFQTDPSVRVFLGSIQASGVGITLTAAAHVIFAELDWVPGNVSQAEDRCHRIGQANSVLVQHIVLDGSLDVRMAHTLVAKQTVIDRALDAKVEMPAEPILPMAEQPATVDTPRSTIAEVAATLTPEQMAAIHQGLMMLAGLCDGARVLDGCGFSKIDVRLGHELASQNRLTPKQAALGRILVRKYRRQLGEDLLAQCGLTKKGG